MTNVTARGVGTTLDDALNEARVDAQEKAGSAGLMLPERFDEAVKGYLVAVRRQTGGAYVSGGRSEDVQESFRTAVQNAGFANYDSEKHRVRVDVALGGLRKAKGQPSGAAPYENPTSHLTGNYF